MDARRRSGSSAGARRSAACSRPGQASDAPRAARREPWWYGAKINHADIAVGCVLRFLGEAHPDVFDGADWPALAAHAAACEALPEFAAVVMPFFVAPPKS